MAASRSRKVVFPANIHQIAADIRRQALQHPDRDPVVPGERSARAGAKRAGTTRGSRTAAKRGTAGRTATGRGTAARTVAKRATAKPTSGTKRTRARNE